MLLKSSILIKRTRVLFYKNNDFWFPKTQLFLPVQFLIFQKDCSFMAFFQNILQATILKKIFDEKGNKISIFQNQS